MVMYYKNVLGIYSVAEGIKVKPKVQFKKKEENSFVLIDYEELSSGIIML